MAQDTIHGIRVELPAGLARAVWAAMWDDDDLATAYIRLAVITSLKRFLKEAITGDSTDFPHEREATIVEEVGSAEADWVRGFDDFTGKWGLYQKSYTTALQEPPF